MTQAQTQNTSNSIIFVEKIVSWDGYLLLDDEYSVMQPVLLIHGNPWSKYKKFTIDQKHKLIYVELRVSKEVFMELLKAGAVRNIGSKITAWHWIPEKAIPILQKHGYKINKGWYKQYLNNIEASRKAEKKLREYEKRYGKHSYGIMNGVLWYIASSEYILVYDGHTGEEYKVKRDEDEIIDELLEKYDPLNYVTR